MKIKVNYSPIYYIIIDDVFSKEANRMILHEAISLEKEFKIAHILKGVNKKIRSNTVAYYDSIYGQNRLKSTLLTHLDNLFQLSEFREMLSSSVYPICDFGMTDFHETQVSRYGDKQKYLWHVDRFANTQRHISLVYYFNEEPPKYTGGELQLSNSPIAREQLIDKNAEIVTIKPQNNRLVVFGGYNAHGVMETKAPKKFGLGRFSANIWVGFKQ